MKKVYCYFLKDEPNELYAFTITKEFKERFEALRNMNLFISGIKEMEENFYSSFSYKNKSKMLTTDYVTDEDKDYEIVVTYEESNKLSESCEYISHTVEAIRSSALREEFHIPKEDLNFIVEITDLLISSNLNRGLININTVKVFYEVCKNTFIENSDLLKEDQTNNGNF